MYGWMCEGGPNWIKNELKSTSATRFSESKRFKCSSLTLIKNNSYFISGISPLTCSQPEINLCSGKWTVGIRDTRLNSIKKKTSLWEKSIASQLCLLAKNGDEATWPGDNKEIEADLCGTKLNALSSCSVNIKPRVGRETDGCRRSYDLSPNASHFSNVQVVLYEKAFDVMPYHIVKRKK